MPERTTQEAFLSTIRAALGRRVRLTDAPPPPAVDESLVRLAGPQDDLIEMFASRAASVGMDVRRITSAQLTEKLIAALNEVEARRIAIAINRLSQSDVVEREIADAGIEICPWRGAAMNDAIYEFDAGVTDVHAAFAETGTMVCLPDADHGRMHSLIPPFHIAIVRCSDIVPDMLDYTATLGDKSPVDLPSSQSFITGPSKTADIEGILITGVHGPGRVIILLVEDD